jgi:hypothetical protein
MGSAELARIGPVREQIICGVLYPRCFANEGGGPIAEAIF